jgi:hypothetical protein
MPPNSCRLTYTHETPAPKNPQPNAKPIQKQRDGGAARQACASQASVMSASGYPPSGANAATVAAPRRNAPE